jgi:hypothetical protein
MIRLLRRRAPVSGPCLPFAGDLGRLELAGFSVSLAPLGPQFLCPFTQNAQKKFWCDWSATLRHSS